MKKRWFTMKARCYNPNAQDYGFYGGRGITVCDEWLNDANAYINYVSQLDNAYKEGMTIDRIDNDGNYEPGNLRWATNAEQMLNRRIQRNNTSGYIGVRFEPGRGVWKVEIKHDGVGVFIGRHDSRHQAAFARNRYIVENDLPHKIQQIWL